MSNCKKTMIYGQQPVYVDLLPPCNNACPAGENIQKWLDLAQAGKFREAWEEIVRNNPMPAVHGRVCYHLCESNCNRVKHDSSVSIHAIERFLGDTALKEGWKISEIAPDSGKKVLIVGAGPAGLSAAHHLRLLGHDVTIYEALPKAGGMMYLGIPDYRLPPDVLQGEIDRILSLGVKLELNRKVTDILAEKKQGGFDAVFLAVGAHIGKLVEVPAVEPLPMWDAIRFLREVKQGVLPKFGKHIVVYGGSNTAMDVARTARRFGYDVTIAYHRTRQRMAAFQFEIDEAVEEGTQLKVLRQLKEVRQNQLIFNIAELDAKGSPQPTGETEIINADLLVFALGQNSETEFLKQVPGIEFKWSCVVVNEQMMSGCEGIFAGGDMIPFDQSVTVAVGHGKKAARNIDAFLRNTTYTKAPKHELVSYEMMNLWFKDQTAQAQQPLLDAEARLASFDEVVSGLSQTDAQHEAKRCFSCGNCFECDACYGVCPYRAIEKLGPGKRYRFDRELCTGCKACFEQCPCHAINMEDEDVSIG